jgi:hypothetical protein
MNQVLCNIYLHIYILCICRTEKLFGYNREGSGHLVHSPAYRTNVIGSKRYPWWLLYVLIYCVRRKSSLPLTNGIMPLWCYNAVKFSLELVVDEKTEFLENYYEDLCFLFDRGIYIYEMCLTGSVKVKLSLCFNWATRHEGVLGSGGIAQLILLPWH